MNVVKFAAEILDMHDRIRDLEKENARLRKYEAMYDDLLKSSLAHNEDSMRRIFDICVTPGVAKAMLDNTKTTDVVHD